MAVTEHTLDVGIVGAGPVGLAAAIAARRAGLRARVWDRGPLAASIVHYPTNMVFFTSDELLEIGDHPLVSLGGKATRREALDYYRKVAEREGLDIATYTEVHRIDPMPSGFRVVTSTSSEETATSCAGVIVATGYYHRPRRLDIPGEDLSHVSHYYREAHPFWHRDVVIVGGGNSAAEAALELWRAGARVAVLVRATGLRDTIKYWLRPDLENRIREGSIGAHFSTTVEEITRRTVRFRRHDVHGELPADAVFLLTGFTADPALVAGAGAEVRADGSVVLDPSSFETTVPGLYVVGSAGCGDRTGEVFIENGRLHAAAAIAHLASRLPPA
jgi:thioredoxin reductase (NADPH)